MMRLSRTSICEVPWNALEICHSQMLGVTPGVSTQNEKTKPDALRFGASKRREMP